MTVKDKDGNALDGAATYRLNVPADAPVELYRSATIYDRATPALIRGRSRSSRSSQNVGPQKNANGSLDVYFAPKAPAGKESNWVPTSADGQFEALFPTKPLFDKTWKLPDIEKIARMSPHAQLVDDTRFQTNRHPKPSGSALVGTGEPRFAVDGSRAPKSLPITSDPQPLVTLFVDSTLGSYSKMQRLRATSSPESARIC
jgi:Protein of unknown function (DUF1214)